MRCKILGIALIVLVAALAMFDIQTPILLLQSTQPIRTYSLNIRDTEYPAVYYALQDSDQYFIDQLLYEEQKLHKSVELLTGRNIETVWQIPSKDPHYYGQIIYAEEDVFWISADNEHIFDARPYLEMLQLNIDSVIEPPVVYSGDDQIMIAAITNEPNSDIYDIVLIEWDESRENWGNPESIYQSDSILQIWSILNKGDGKTLLITRQQDGSSQVGLMDLTDGGLIKWQDITNLEENLVVLPAGDVEWILAGFTENIISFFQIAYQDQTWDVNELGKTRLPVSIRNMVLYSQNKADLEIFLISNPENDDELNQIYHMECSDYDCADLVNIGLEHSIHSQLQIAQDLSGRTGISWIETVQRDYDQVHKLWYLPLNYEFSEAEIVLMPTATNEPIIPTEIIEIQGTESAPFNLTRDAGIIAETNSEQDEYIILGIGIAPVILFIVAIIGYRRLRNK